MYALEATEERSGEEVGVSRGLRGERPLRQGSEVLGMGGEAAAVTERQDFRHL